MRKIYLTSIAILIAFTTLFTTITSCNNKYKTETEIEGEEENDMYDNPEAAANFQLKRTRDLTTGQIPAGAYMAAFNETMLRKEIVSNSANNVDAFTWVERGPNTDVSGPSNGNTRANNAITSGRIDAILVDASDATGKTLFAGGRGGGLWKTNDITVSPANWTLVNDFLLNQSIAAICQDPTNLDIMYMATGESFGAGGAIRGNGVFKSIDHGLTWAQLLSTTSYLYCTRILCDAAGNIYLGTNGNGLVRSTKASGGAAWTNISPNGATRIADLDLSSTGRLHVTVGIFSTNAYAFTDNPLTVTSATWSSPTSPYPSVSARCEMAVSGNTLYALPGNTAYQVPTIYKSTDGGDNWIATGGQPATGWASGQAWYALTAVINPSNPNECIIGGLDQHKTTNGGASWTKISAWVGTFGQYVHADSHQTLWYDGGNKIVFACDGGIHFSADGGTTIRDRNAGLRLKQFYSIAMHPTNINYFLAGAQDNGTHQLNNPGLSGSVEVTGGDGAFVDIDQNEPQYQMGAYVYNNYRRSTNAGVSWSSVNFSNSIGQFINPFDYDDSANIMYCGYGASNFLRWENPQTGNTTTVVPVTSFNGGAATSMQASPYTPNTVFFGTSNGRVVKVADANSTLISEINITPAGMNGYVNSINVGASDQNLVATVTNYNTNNVWVSNNGGTSWTAVDGNLPNLPVYWALYNPDDNTKLIIATETGVWQTDLLNGAATNWLPDATFPTVRVTMLKYRALDRTIGASSYGRGVWSTNLPTLTCVPVGIITNPANTSVCAGTNASFSITTTGSPTITYQWYISVASGAFTPIVGATTANYSFSTTFLQNGNQYRCVATGSCGVPLTQTSTAATLTVTTVPIVNIPLSNVTVCAGTNTSIVANATGGTILKWQVSTNGGTVFTDLSNAAPYSNVTTTTLNITGASIALNNYQYRLVAATGTCSTNSNAALLVVNTAAAISTIGQPINTSICTNGTNTASFIVNATGSGLTYQWYSSPTGNAGTFVIISLATNATYTTGVVTNTTDGFYQVIVSGACGAPITSSIAQLLISAVPTVTLITTIQTVCAPTTATYTCTATGTSITYQWQYATIAGGTFNPVVGGSGGSTSTYTTGATDASMNGWVYRVVVTGSCAPSATSANATLTVNTSAAITTAPIATTVCNGTTASFAVVATGTNLNYQWQSASFFGGTYNNITSGTGGTTANYTTAATIPTNNGTYYRVIVTSGLCAPAVLSIPVLLTVNTVAVIGTQPTAQSACIPQTATFNVSATGTGLSYQWQLAPAGSSIFANIISATSASYTTPASDLTMNGNQYRVNILSACSPLTPTASNTVVLTTQQASL